MNKFFKILLALSSACLVIAGLAVGIDYCATLALSTVLRTGLRWATVGSGVAIVVIFALDAAISWWNANKNKKKFE